VISPFGLRCTTTFFFSSLRETVFAGCVRPSIFTQQNIDRVFVLVRCQFTISKYLAIWLIELFNQIFPKLIVFISRETRNSRQFVSVY